MSATATLCRWSVCQIAVQSYGEKNVSRMRTRALQPKGRKLVTPSTPTADYQAVAAADGSTSGSTNAHTGTDTGTVKTSRPLVKISRPLVKISRPLVKKYRREIFTRGRDVVRPLVCPLVLPPYKNSILKIRELSARCKRCHQFVFYTNVQRMQVQMHSGDPTVHSKCPMWHYFLNGDTFFWLGGW